MIVKVIGKTQCDLYPNLSIHEGEKTEKGFYLGNANWISNEFELEEIGDNFPPMSEMKSCPMCKVIFDKEAQFIICNQIGDPESMCMRCYERRYVVGSEEYKKALTIEILNELKLK